MTVVVYWLKYLEHNDPYSQGYIGISTNFNSRKWAHENGKSGNHIYNRINNGAAFEIMHECDTVEEAVFLEERYRPDENIGWNLARGGGLPPSQKGKSYPKQKLKGDNRTEAQKRAHKIQAEKIRGRPSPRKGSTMKQSSKEMMGKSIIINGIRYGTYSDAAKSIGKSVSTITLWSKKGSCVITSREGCKYTIEILIERDDVNGKSCR